MSLPTTSQGYPVLDHGHTSEDETMMGSRLKQRHTQRFPGPALRHHARDRCSTSSACNTKNIIRAPSALLVPAQAPVVQLLIAYCVEDGEAEAGYTSPLWVYAGVLSARGMPALR